MEEIDEPGLTTIGKTVCLRRSSAVGRERTKPTQALEDDECQTSMMACIITTFPFEDPKGFCLLVFAVTRYELF